jgi:hypothetical protein
MGRGRACLFVALAFLSGCASLPFMEPARPTIPSLSGAAEATSSLSALTWVGAILILAGTVTVVLTRTRGYRAIAVGAASIGLAYVMAQIDLDWVLIPIYIGGGAVSLAWAFVTVRRILNRRSG